MEHLPECVELDQPPYGTWWCICSALRACEQRMHDDYQWRLQMTHKVGIQLGIIAVREEFLKLLTQDSETRDMRRKEYNQAIFNPEGWAVFNGTDLNMVMDKFDHAVKNLDKRTPPTV